MSASSIEQQLPVALAGAAELELGVGEDEFAGGGVRGALAVERRG